MSYKLVCMDMDGTLLGENFTIPEDNIRAIKEGISKGIKMALVTGRPFNAMKYFKNILGDEILVISTNGTYFKVKDYEYKKPISNEQIEIIYKIGEKYGLTRHYKGAKKVIANSRLWEDHPYFKINKDLSDEDKIVIIEDAELEDVFNNNNEEMTKCILLSDDLEAIAMAKEELRQYDILEVVSSNSKNIEVMPAGTSKATAISELIKVLGITREEVICIGDNENDLSMIEYAGLGVAMENAEDFVKEKADYITDTNLNAGVAKVIDKFVLMK